MIQRYDDDINKISKRFNVSPAELIALIPKGDRRELIGIVKQIEEKEAELRPHLAALEKTYDWRVADYRYVDALLGVVACCEAKAALYLKPVYEGRKAWKEENKKALASFTGTKAGMA